MNQGDVNFEDLRAPEVVQPLPTKRQTPPQGVQSAPPLQQSPPPSQPSPPAIPLPPPPVPPPLRDSSSTEISTFGRVLIAMAIVAVFLLVFGVALSEPGNRKQISEQSVAPVSDSVVNVPLPPQESLPQSSIPHPLQEPEAIPVQPQPVGSARLSAFALDSVGVKHPIKADAALSFSRPGLPVAVSTNVGLPWLWQNVPPGDYWVTIAATGFHSSETRRISIVPDTTNHFAIPLRPLSVIVDFAFPATDIVFNVYSDAILLDSPNNTLALEWFIPHILTFKARGWRDKRMKVQLAAPGKAYHCPIEIERVASALSVSMTNRTGELPKSCFLTVNSQSPIKVDLPFVWPALHSTGAVSLALTVEGYNVLNNTQQVVLVDRARANVLFIVEKKGLVSRLFSR